MKTRYHRILSVVLAAAATCAVAAGTRATAQVTLDIPMLVTDNGDGATPGIDTLYFGVNPNATNGKDQELGEEEQPPAPPEGVFDARWVNVGTSKDFGQGVKKNYRAYTSPTQIDTFRLKVQPGFKPGSAGYPMHLAWPDLKSDFAAASLRFVDGDGTPASQDMMAANTFTFSNPSSVTSTITIVTERPGTSSGVEAVRATAFSVIAMPNPVSRDAGATITFRLEHPATVACELYNVLGQRVRADVTGERPAGEGTLHMETRGLAAGSYICVLTAGEHRATRSFIVIDR